MVRIGLLRETKSPPDRRVPLTPAQIAELKEVYPGATFIAQSSQLRCFDDSEYSAAGAIVSDSVADCDILLGVKEVAKETLLDGKRYLFFAHVAKEQPYNRDMFREIVRRGITLTDYEYLVDEKGDRVVAFGRWAGVVGAYNALIGVGVRTGLFELKPANQCWDIEELWQELEKVKLPDNYKIVVTGDGRVAGGAMEILDRCNILRVSPEEYLEKSYNQPVLCQTGPREYTRRRDGLPFEWSHFISNPSAYESAFRPFTRESDLFIACHYWDPASPHFFTAEETKESDFRISVVADISCDVAGPVPTTIRASTIAEPFFDYNPATGKEEKPFSSPDNITVMSIDNLPGELPRDASGDFGKLLITSVIDDLINGRESRMLSDATITRDGKLTSRFEYLEEYLRS